MGNWRIEVWESTYAVLESGYGGMGIRMCGMGIVLWGETDLMTTMATAL